jgi:hypothetical protein|nr:hypothetical protein [Ferroplasma sp.]
MVSGKNSGTTVFRTKIGLSFIKMYNEIPSKKDDMVIIIKVGAINNIPPDRNSKHKSKLLYKIIFAV